MIPAIIRIKFPDGSPRTARKIPMVPEAVMIAPENFRWLSTKNAATNPITELTNIIGLTSTSEARIPRIPPNNPKMNSSDLLANHFHPIAGSFTGCPYSPQYSAFWGRMLWQF